MKIKTRFAAATYGLGIICKKEYKMVIVSTSFYHSIFFPVRYFRWMYLSFEEHFITLCLCEPDCLVG